MKGQVELVVILAVVIVGVIAVLYALQIISLEDFTLDPNQRLVKESVENTIHEAAIQTLRRVSLQGGYLEPQPNSVALAGDAVPFWQYNGQPNIPDLKQNLENGIRNYITTNKVVLEKALEGKGAVIQDPNQVSVSIRPGSFDVVVNMPTRVKGQDLSQPYKVSIKSELSEILEFSRNFLENQKNSRYFETFTMSSILMSEYDGDVQKLPTVVALTDCGKSVHKSYTEIKTEMEKAIKRTVAQTYTPGKYPQNIIEVSSSPKYSLPQLNGKEYENLDVNFWVVDGFTLNSNTFQFFPDPITAQAKPIPLAGACESEPLYVQYSMNYPVVVSVNDKLTGIPLQFAFNVLIVNNEPAPYQNLVAVERTQCENPQCDMNLDVIDTSGQPLDGVSVSFLSCPIGETINGNLQAKIPCGLGILVLTKDRYDSYFNSHPSNDLENIQATLEKQPLVTIKFWEANVRKEPVTQGYQYRIGEGIGSDSDINPVRDGVTVAMTLISDAAGFQFSPQFFDSKGGAMEIPTGTHTIQAVLLDNELTKSYGSFITTHDIRESLDGGELNIYIPYSVAYADIQDQQEQFKETLRLTNLLESCGVGPISETELTTFNGCVKQDGELLA